MSVETSPLSTQPNRFISGLWRWRPGERKTLYLCALLFTVCGFVLVTYMGRIRHDYGPGHPPPLGDFFGLWSYPELAGLYPPTDLYDPAVLHARQVALGMDPAASAPFPYPPTVLLLLWPIRWLPYDLAYPAWILGTFGLYLWAVAGTCSRLKFCILGVIIAPATAMTMTAGQSGFLAAALLTAGIRLAPVRPVVAGCLLGLLCYKPQFGILVPFALAAASLWPAFIAASVTVVIMVAAATVAFGADMWPAWLSALRVYAAMFDGLTGGLTLMPTVAANLRLAGAPLPIANIGQALVSAGVVVGVAWCFRRNPGRLATAALLVGTLLATPHAFVYDLPMLYAAVALFIQCRSARGFSFNLMEVAILVMLVIFPVLMVLGRSGTPVSAIPLLLFFALIVWRHLTRPGAA